MSNKPCHEPGNSACGFIAVERNHYFTGKYMAARDFTIEQEYFLSHHRLHNRVLHGWGIVCGLAVMHHPDPECRKRWVVAKAGIAVDCCGRELILPKDTAIELELPPDWNPQAYSDEQQEQSQPPEQQQGHVEYGCEQEFLLCLKYEEHHIERVPALYNEGVCDPSRTDYNRIRECAKLVVLDPHEVPECWKHSRSMPTDWEHYCRDDCDENIPGPAGICLDPVCPCQDTVPLALIQWCPDDPKRYLRIHMDGRRTLPTPPEFLTHIIGTNWPHG